MQSDKIYEIIVAVITGEATPEEKDNLQKWLEQSPENREEYIKAEKLYNSLKTTTSVDEIHTDTAWNKVYAQTIRKENKRIMIRISRYAAVILFLIGIGSLFYFRNSGDNIKEDMITLNNVTNPTLFTDDGQVVELGKESFSLSKEEVIINNEANKTLTYEKHKDDFIAKKEKNASMNHLIIPHSNTYQLILSDGTRVWLNSESQLVYPSAFSAHEREVKLIGEAYFEVTPDKARPFVVKTEGMDIKVLGTSFNISCYPEESCVSATLVEGSVLISLASGREQIISPSQQLKYDAESHKVELHNVDTQLYTSWKEGIYIFKNLTLEEIMRKLQRWHTFTISYEDESLKNRRYNLQAERDFALDKLLELISFSSDIQFEKNQSLIHIKRKENANEIIP